MSLSDLGCVKTVRGITAPGISGSTVMRRAKNRKSLSSARHYDQIRFRFHTAKTHSEPWAPLVETVNQRIAGRFSPGTEAMDRVFPHSAKRRS
jgi:hypothetical protein